MSSDQKLVAFITGGNRGIGYETARELGEKGIFVVIGCRDLDKGRDAVTSLQKLEIEADAISFDADDQNTFQKIYDYFERKFGKLDILVNNAGVMLENLGGSNDTETVSQEILRKTFDVNFFSVVSLTQTLLPLIRKSEAGRIVNLSSILGSLTLHSDPKSPIAGSKQFAYNASKSALNAFTIHLAHALVGTSIKVNSAHPGWVKTEMGGSNATLDLEEGGKTSAELATLAADGPTGAFQHLGQSLPW